MSFVNTIKELLACGNEVSTHQASLLIQSLTFGDDEILSNLLQFGNDGLICRTQDQFVNDLDTLDMFEHLIHGNKFNCVDMEAYALAKVCGYMNKDFICYKYISDDADGEADSDWQQNVAGGEELFYDILNLLF